jgi:hypothetical protein
MAQRNRVTPLGDIVAAPLRGAWTGNRGCLHRGEEVVRFHARDLWIVCALRFKDRHSALWRPGRFTWRFFHDEAVAFAAGHRPCGECRHAAYVAYRDAWAGPAPDARTMNRVLHAQRLQRGTHRRRLHEAAWRDLPDGAFVLVDGTPAVVVGDRVIAWDAATGYGAGRARPARGRATLITPPATVAVLRAGYPVQIDASAGQRTGR